MHPNIVWGLTLGTIAIALLGLADQPQAQLQFVSHEGMLWPALVLWGLLVCSLVLAADGLARVRARRSAAQSKSNQRFPYLPILCCTAYFALLNVIGFLLATFLLCGAFAMLLGYRNRVATLVYSASVSLVVWLVFIELMRVPLPRGIGIFRELSLFFY